MYEEQGPGLTLNCSFVYVSSWLRQWVPGMDKSEAPHLLCSCFLSLFQCFVSLWSFVFYFLSNCDCFNFYVSVLCDVVFLIFVLFCRVSASLLIELSHKTRNINIILLY